MNEAWLSVVLRLERSLIWRQTVTVSQSQTVLMQADVESLNRGGQGGSGEVEMAAGAPALPFPCPGLPYAVALPRNLRTIVEVIWLIGQ
jgi:hypothetical protein